MNNWATGYWLRRQDRCLRYCYQLHQREVCHIGCSYQGFPKSVVVGGHHLLLPVLQPVLQYWYRWRPAAAATKSTEVQQPLVEQPSTKSV